VNSEKGVHYALVKGSKTFTVAYCTSRGALEALFNLGGCHFYRLARRLLFIARPRSPCYPRYPFSLKSYFLWSMVTVLPPVAAVARVSLV